MIRKLNRYRLALVVTFLAELLICVLVGIFLWFDIAGFADIKDISYYLILGLGVFLVCDTLFFLLALADLTKSRQKADMSAASLLGNDIQSAYNVIGVGIIIIDENNHVIWTNQLFENAHHRNFIDDDVYDIFPQLKSVPADKHENICLVDIDESRYNVKYFSQSRMFVFQDVTNYVNLKNLYDREAMALGLIVIDNYQESSSDSDENAEIDNRMRGAISDYFRRHNVVLHRIKNDTYFAVCNHEALATLEEDKFSILDIMRSAQDKRENPYTLSIGFAHDFPGVVKLNDMVYEAINLVQARGGDQAAVCRYGHDAVFYGGTTVAKESTSKVQVRSYAESAASLLRRASQVFIMGHTDMDMDALGSALGMLAFCEYLKKPARIVYDPKRTEKKTRLAFQSAFSRDVLLNMTVTPEEALSQTTEETMIVVVDVSRPKLTMAPALLEKAVKVMVIDHHRRAEDFIDHPVLSYIEPSASSASELVAEMIRYANFTPAISLKPAYATIMLSGIFLDSNFFKSKATGMRTFQAAQILKTFGADNTLADDYLKDDFEEYSLINSIVLRNKTFSYGVLICSADDNVIVERSTLSKVANQIMQLKDTHCCFVIGRISSTQIKMSARSDGTVNVQLICEKIGGGGHLSMAAADFNETSVEAVERTLQSVLSNYLDSARNNQIGN